ncbi:flagellum site-determining protein YlxH [Sporosarcina sp. NCCP-2222]|uniref:MinD/ParA family protein n=1 Tax=Sporosarcina sp. NCCP-2222 TaxID=2935073 RepID=UPI0020849D58|nr:MinD/ParA family protein [Sporosarcina sp. NCCP-2222]GKV55572.1 flagellum site-determining protein YlxH [Sporosarcina sp. NCCP-2222]
MRDQAEALRLKMLRAQGGLARSIAVVSGKGGVGKSNFSTNFAYALQNSGKKVIIVDMDIGMGNIHILLGSSPAYSLKDYVSGQKTLQEVITMDTEGLAFISGGSGLDSVLDWSAEMFNRLLEAFDQLQQEYDFILFDMGAGATQSSIDLIIAVDEVIVISTTEPTSITDAYSMMKFIYLKDPEKRFHLVSNRVAKQEEGLEAARRLQFAMKKFLNKETTILGFLPEDPAVHTSVVAQKPFLLYFPDAPVSRKMKTIATAFAGISREQETSREQSFLGRLKSLFSRGRD